jgi:hypothetical protein
MPGMICGREIDAYFASYLPSFYGRQMIPNLVSLSALFWIEVLDRVWSLEIRCGILEGIAVQERKGDFGYRTTPETFLAVVRAEMSPQKSFFLGKTKIEGNFLQALKTATALEEFFQRFSYHQ